MYSYNIIMNPVEEFLSNNKNVTYSCKTMSKRLNMRGKDIIYYALSSSNLKRVPPIEVGCGKHSMLIFKYED